MITKTNWDEVREAVVSLGGCQECGLSVGTVQTVDENFELVRRAWPYVRKFAGLPEANQWLTEAMSALGGVIPE